MARGWYTNISNAALAAPYSQDLLKGLKRTRLSKNKSVARMVPKTGYRREAGCPGSP